MERTISANFYDIESLRNVFTLALYKPSMNDDQQSVLEVYYLHDKSEDSTFNVADHVDYISDRVKEKNKNFKGTVELYDLHDGDSVYKLAKTFGVSKAWYINREQYNSYRTVCDTDEDYSEQYAAGNAPYLFGYNSANYDTTMLAWILSHICLTENKEPKTKWDKYKYRNVCGKELNIVSARQIREFNDVLFKAPFKDNNHMPDALRYETLDDMYGVINGSHARGNYNSIYALVRKNMLMTGRNLDVAKLPGKQSFLGLKRLLGMLGYQILESDKLSGDSFIYNIDQMADLIAYNASDVINLELLFYNDAYKAPFELKRELLNTYKELVYESIDESVNEKSFVMFPERQGEFCEEEHAYQEYAPIVGSKHVRSDRLLIDSSSAQFATKVLCPYGRLKDSATVQYMYPEEHEAKRLGVKSVDVLEETKKWIEDNLAGAEFVQARAEFQDIYDYYASLRGKNFNGSKSYATDYDILHHPKLKPCDIKDDNVFPLRNNCMTYYDGNGNKNSCYVNFSIGGIHGAEYNKAKYELDKTMFAADAGKYKKPTLFPYANHEKTELNGKYAYTSCDLTNHEDFTSYYPNLLRRMRAFWNNGLGYDRYGVIFDLKQKYGKLMKDKSLSEEERNHYRILREGTKLILNSASGAADASFENAIRMNNKIISMRIIGQLFTFRIGMAQSLKGARIISTNTDGLYSVLEETINNKILEEESKNINVEIEPEPVYLISKDSNNRIEAEPTDDGLYIVAASGGTVACRKGPNPQKSLDHPAIVDWILSEYLVEIANSDLEKMSKPFDYTLGEEIMIRALSGNCVYNKELVTSAGILNMFQMMVSSNPATYSYKYGLDSAGNLIILQHYNRAFIMQEGTEGKIIHIQQAMARAVSIKTIEKRIRESEPVYQHDDIALKVLTKNGYSKEAIEAMANPRREAVAMKVPKLGDDWNILIENHNLNELSEERRQWILCNIDKGKYLQMVADSFEKCWMNKMPGNYISQEKLSF